MQVKPLFFTLLLFVVMQGCSLFPPKPIDIGGFNTVDAETAAMLTTSLRKHSQSVTSARIMLEATVVRGAFREKSVQVIAFEHPSRLRMDVLAPGVNQLLFLIVSDGDFLTAYDLREKLAYQAQPSKEIIDKLLAVPLAPEELMYWVTGSARIPDKKSVHRLDVLQSEGGESYALRITSADGRTIVVEFHCISDVKAQCQTVVIEKYDVLKTRGGELLMSTSYSYADAEECEKIECNHCPPAKIQVRLPKRGLNLLLEINEFQKNPDLESVRERLFSIKLPNGVRVMNLDQVDLDSPLLVNEP